MPRVLAPILIVAAFCGFLGACGSFKVDYNSPLEPAPTGRLPANAANLFGHWTGGPEGAPASAVGHLYIGLLRQSGSDATGDRHERLVMISMNPDKPSGWALGQAYVTTIRGVDFLNISRNLFDADGGWSFKTVKTSEDGRTLTLHDIGVFSGSELRQAGLLDIDPNDEGGTVARYIRRFGHQGLLRGRDAVYWRTPREPGPAASARLPTDQSISRMR